MELNSAPAPNISSEQLAGTERINELRSGQQVVNSNSTPRSKHPSTAHPHPKCADFGENKFGTIEPDDTAAINEDGTSKRKGSVDTVHSTGGTSLNVSLMKPGVGYRIRPKQRPSTASGLCVERGMSPVTEDLLSGQRRGSGLGVYSSPGSDDDDERGGGPGGEDGNLTITIKLD